MSSGKVVLSASKIKTAASCSWKYWANYVLKLPSSTNDGASRGWICHLIFELLGSKKHKKNYNAIVKSGTIYNCPSVFRLVKYHARLLNVADDENMEMMDCMIVKGLLYDFFGKKSGKLSEAISEQEFNIDIDEDGKKYSIRGFIDKLFLYNRKTKALIRDFKTSKEVFKGKEITDNLQNLMYCLAVKKLFPKVKEIDVEFLFLKFPMDEDIFGAPGKGVVKMERISDGEMEGFEYQLTSIQEYLENFNELDAVSNFAANQPYPVDKTFGGPLMCGKEGFKKSRGEFVLDSSGNKIKSFICEHRLPQEYYVFLDKDGNILQSFKEKPTNPTPNNLTLEKRFYKGCPHFFEIPKDLV